VKQLGYKRLLGNDTLG